jgi:DNA-binding FadR family transcriptional regulator
LTTGESIIQQGLVSESAPRLLPSHGRLSEAVQQAIRQYILDRRLGAGDPLPPEGQLARELGVSRPSVREAVKGLEALGILEARMGVGIFVRPFSFGPILDNLAYSIGRDRDSVADLLYVRKQLEAGAIEDVAERVTRAQLRVLRSVVDRMGERAAQGDASPAEDRFFHHALFAGIEKPLLIKLLDVFWEVYRRLRDQTALAASADPIRSWENHRRIVEALETGDRAAARGAMLRHFVGLETRLQDTRWRGDASDASAGEAGYAARTGRTKGTA